MKLLLLVPRGLQAAMIGPYGNRWVDTPNFDLLAEAGTVFDRHFSARPGTPLLDAALLEALRNANVPVRFVRDTIDHTVYRAIGSRHGGEVATID